MQTSIWSSELKACVGHGIEIDFCLKCRGVCGVMIVCGGETTERGLGQSEIQEDVLWICACGPPPEPREPQPLPYSGQHPPPNASRREHETFDAAA
jgi:hypothetical protein